jgi:cysteine desulfurase
LAQESGTALVSVQLANNETGVLQPIRDIVELAKRHGAVVHADAVQAAGRIPIQVEALGVDAVSISAHKLGGPTGVGALVLRQGSVLTADRSAGGQERGRRPGTENVAGIAGFGVAADLAADSLDAEADRLSALQLALQIEIKRIAPDAVIFGESATRLPNTVCFAAPGFAAETLLIALDLDGVAVSSGSACSSGRVGRSHVLAAMGVEPTLAAGAIRLSVGWDSTQSDVQGFAQAFEMAAERLYATRSPRAA